MRKISNAPASSRVQAAGPAPPVSFTVDGRPLEGRDGESVLAALWAAGVRSFHRTARFGDARGPFCGMGVCFDCLVVVDCRRNVRACMMLVREGMRVETQDDAGVLGPEGIAHARD